MTRTKRDDRAVSKEGSAGQVCSGKLKAFIVYEIEKQGDQGIDGTSKGKSRRWCFFVWEEQKVGKLSWCLQFKLSLQPFARKCLQTLSVQCHCCLLKLGGELDQDHVGAGDVDLGLDRKLHEKMRPQKREKEEARD